MFSQKQNDHSGLNQLFNGQTDNRSSSVWVRAFAWLMMVVFLVVPSLVIFSPHDFLVPCACFCSSNFQNFINSAAQWFR